MELEYFLYPFSINSTEKYQYINRTAEDTKYSFSNNTKNFDIIIPEAFFKDSLCKIEVPLCMLSRVARMLKLLYKKYKEGKIVNLEGDICLTVPFIIRPDLEHLGIDRRSIKRCIKLLTETEYSSAGVILKNNIIGTKGRASFYETCGCLTDINSNVLLIYTVNLYNKDIYKSEREKESDYSNTNSDLDLKFSCADPAIRFNKDILKEDTLLNKEIMKIYKYMLKSINLQHLCVSGYRSYIDLSNLSLTIEDLSRYNIGYKPIRNLNNIVDDEKYIKNLVNNYLDMFEKGNNINFAYV